MREHRERHSLIPDRLRKRIRFGALTWALLAAALAVTVGLNILVTRLEKDRGWQRDLSFNGVTSYGAVTEQVLRDLRHPVRAYLVYEDDLELQALLDRYAAASPNFSWEPVDLSLNPGFLTRYRTETQETSVGMDSIVFDCEETGRFRVVSSRDFQLYTYDDAGNLQFTGRVNYENAVTYAIQYVTRETSPRAVILHGHGEMNEEETEALAYLLSRRFYRVVYASLDAQQLTLGEDDVVLILAPDKDISSAELDRLTAYAEAGGSFVFVIDPETPTEDMPNLCALMRHYGMEPLANLVTAADGDACYDGNPYFLIPAVQRTEVTEPMAQNGGALLLLPYASAFATPETADPYVYTDVMLTGGQEESGASYALALLGMRITQQGMASRAFAVGSSSAMTDTGVYARTDNRELIVRVMGWLAGESEFLGIEARDAVRPQLSARSVDPGTAAVFMLPVIVAAAAVTVLWIRRRKH